MPQSHRRFTQEFRDEAVRLAETSGRTRREVAEDLGIGLSTLRHWLDRRRSRRWTIARGRQEDVTAELQRLRRERDPAPGAGHPQAGHGFFRQGGKYALDGNDRVF